MVPDADTTKSQFLLLLMMLLLTVIGEGLEEGKNEGRKPVSHSITQV